MPKAKQPLFQGILLLVAFAFLGFLLISVPPQLVEHYENLQERTPLWATVYLVTVGTGGVLLIGITGWLCVKLWLRSRKKQAHRQIRASNPSELTPQQQEAELAKNLDDIETLGMDAVSPEVRNELNEVVNRLNEKRQAERLEIVAFGSISSGKSSLLNALCGSDRFATDARGGTTVRRAEVPWPGLENVQLVDAPGLGEVDGEEHVRIAAESAGDADLVLLVVDGPLRESEFSLIRRLGEMEKRLLVCLNKVDWYDEGDRLTLLGQIREQTASFVDRRDVVSVQASPIARERVRVLPSGDTVQEQVDVPADISELADRMLAITGSEGRELLLANLLLQSRGLMEDARERVRQALDDRARVVIDKYMWGAAGAAAVSPLPILDLMAGSAISAKMVFELAKVYHHEIDMDTAVSMLAQLTKNLIGILGAGLATPAVAAAVASSLKTVPGIGTIVGGALQGTVQAVITRWIGGVFMRYFRDEMKVDSKGLAEMAREEWDHVTQVKELRKLLVEARHRFKKG
ncbi:MAG: GTP-binding protein [Pirellulaceae bacterium]